MISLDPDKGFTTSALNLIDNLGFSEPSTIWKRYIDKN